MTEKIHAATHRIEKRYPGTTTRVVEVGEGIVLVDFHRNDELVVLHYKPEQGFGTAVINDDEFFGQHIYDPAGKSIASAEDAVGALLQKTVKRAA